MPLLQWVSTPTIFKFLPRDLGFNANMAFYFIWYNLKNEIKKKNNFIWFKEQIEYVYIYEKIGHGKERLQMFTWHRDIFTYENVFISLLQTKVRYRLIKTNGFMKEVGLMITYLVLVFLNYHHSFLYIYLVVFVVVVELYCNCRVSAASTSAEFALSLPPPCHGLQAPSNLMMWCRLWSSGPLLSSPAISELVVIFCHSVGIYDFTSALWTKRVSSRPLPQ